MIGKINLYLIFLFFTVIVPAGSVFADIPEEVDPDNKILKARDTVLFYFKPVSGKVENIDDDTVRIKIDNDTGLRKGMRLSVFREGEPFHHPVTNELIGYTENFIGRIEVIGEASVDGFYLCSIIKGDIKPGDIARITSSKIRLAVFQDRKSDWELSEAFFESLKSADRFEILEKYTPSYETETLSEIARDLGAEAVLMFSTPVKDNRKRIKISLYWARDSSKFLEIEKLLSREEVQLLRPDEELSITYSIGTEPWGSYKIEDGRLIAMGDVDNSGEREIVISDGHNIRIYKFKGQLQEIWHIKGNSDERHLSLDVLDLNNNGMAEIFVTSIKDGSGISSNITDTEMSASGQNTMVNSFIIEFDQSEGYRRLADMPYFFRVYGQSLLMQKFDTRKIFGGPVYEGRWKDEKYLPAKAMDLPSGVNIYGFAMVDWRNSGETHLVSFDDAGYLNLFDSDGNYLWRSDESYGKFELTFEEKTYSLAKPTIQWAVRGRLITVQTKRGQEILVVDKKPLVPKVPGLGARGAEIYALWWNGGEMEDSLVLGEVPGSVTDYWIERGRLFLVARGNMISFVKNVASGEFEKGSMLYYYNLGEK